MNNRKRIEELYERLTSNQISEKELDEFLSYLENNKNKTDFDKESERIWLSFNETGKNNLVLQKKRLRERLQSEGSTKRVQIRLIRRYGVAATVAVIVALSVFFSGVFSGSIEYSTDFAEKETVHLPDGSTVELNANSKILWDKNWDKEGVRKIHLEGEAYFDIVHLDKDQKFIVSTSDVEIEVLGTSFNVSDRSDKTDVFLQEGSIKLGLKGKEQRELLMSPGQRISYSREEDRIIEHKKDNSLVASWKNDVLYFNDKTVEEILLKVSHLYGVEFVFADPSIKNLKLNFYVPYRDWEVAKQAFELTMDVTLELQKNGKYMVSKK